MTGSRSRFVRKAFIVGLFVYAVLRLAMHVLMSQAEPLSFASGYWFQILTPVITGYAAGFAAKHDGLSHGAIIGASIPIIESIGFSIATLNISIGLQLLGMRGAMWVVSSVFFGALGGFIWDFQSRSGRRAP